jgi:hypothetical protein
MKVRALHSPSENPERQVCAKIAFSLLRPSEYLTLLVSAKLANLLRRNSERCLRIYF